MRCKAEVNELIVFAQHWGTGRITAGLGQGWGLGLGDHDALWVGEGGSDKRDWLLRGPQAAALWLWVLICRLIQPVGLEHDQRSGGRAQGVCVCVYGCVCGLGSVPEPEFEPLSM